MIEFATGLLIGVAIGIYYEVRHDAWWVIRSAWADFNDWRKG